LKRKKGIKFSKDLGSNLAFNLPIIGLKSILNRNKISWNLGKN
jgi:hypothetical protein